MAFVHLEPLNASPPKQGLELDRVVLLGRTLEEYQRFFALDLDALRDKRILDVASGVSSFTAEARALGLNTTALDRIYSLPIDEIRRRCEHDLAEVAGNIATKKVYRWDFYKSAEGMRAYRERAYQSFLLDFAQRPTHYIAGELPFTPFTDHQFELTLVSYLLFVYEDQLTYEFHRETLRELMRIATHEIRIYPIVTFEGEPSKFLQRIRVEPGFANWEFDIVPTDFEFLRGSNSFLRLKR